ncbi:unnamed protein product [Polarella glacialis]|uniref:Endonuclease/exonuclease/phosphatase domain-containing protein n=1 Tax=Polarella glacialis TaxID=89957 RepID=A0A813LEI8_POLGL|nr:unnamed protein product [Polarella glacialis]
MAQRLPFLQQLGHSSRRSAVAAGSALGLGATLCGRSAPHSRQCRHFQAAGFRRGSATHRPGLSMRMASSSVRELEVWSFNLRTEFAEEQDGDNGWSRRRQDVAKFIAARRPALICAQEATEAMLEYLTKQLGPEEYAWAATSRRPGVRDETAGFIFDRRQMELVDHSAAWLAPPGVANGEPAWDARMPRTYEAALFRVLGCGGGKTRPLLRVLNTHLDHVGVQARKCSAELLAAAVASFALQLPSSPQILCGDFNSAKDSAAYAILTQGSAERAAPLRDAVRAAASDEPLSDRRQSTIHKWKGEAFAEAQGDGTVDLQSADTARDGQHIDWLLWRDGAGADGEGTILQPLRYRVITDRLDSGGYPSDHYPVSVTFAICERPPSSGEQQLRQSRL